MQVRRTRQDYLTKQEEKDILALNGLKTQKAIAEQFNISEFTVRKVFERNKIVWIKQLADQTGDKHHHYKDGLSRVTIAHKTRIIVVKSGRSLFICERCGDVNKETEQHRHHKDRDISNNITENIEVLCVSCHTKEHVADRTRGENGRYVS